MIIPPADLTPHLPPRCGPNAYHRRTVIRVIRDPVLVSPPAPSPVTIDASAPPRDELGWTLFSVVLVILVIIASCAWVFR
mgnify:FL=1